MAKRNPKYTATGTTTGVNGQMLYNYYFVFKINHYGSGKQHFYSGQFPDR